MASASPPIVSVVIPVYNGERYLHQAIESVLAQTFRSYEIVCVDDGSTDGSKNILNEYVGRLRVIEQANAGQSAARNAGVRHAQGTYIAFLDQDDCWYPHKLAAQVEALASEPDAVLVHCNSDRMDAEGRIIQRGAALTEMTSALQSPLGCLLGEGLILPSSMLVRRDVFEQAGGFDGALRGYEDFDLCARLKQRGRFIFLEEPGMCYRLHPGGFNQTGAQAIVRSRERFLNNMLAFYAGDKAKIGIVHRQLAECYSDWGMDEMKAGHFRDAQRMLLRSLHFNPVKFRTYSRLIRLWLSHVT